MADGRDSLIRDANGSNEFGSGKYRVDRPDPIDLESSHPNQGA
jgi:hypothetical protein